MIITAITADSGTPKTKPTQPSLKPAISHFSGVNSHLRAGVKSVCTRTGSTLTRERVFDGHYLSRRGDGASLATATNKASSIVFSDRSLARTLTHPEGRRAHSCSSWPATASTGSGSGAPSCTGRRRPPRLLLPWPSPRPPLGILTAAGESGGDPTVAAVWTSMSSRITVLELCY